MATSDEIKEILRKIAEGTATDKDIEVLRQVDESEERITIQFGKQIINLGQGTGNHFGDHIIYQGPDAETIRQVLQQVLDETARLNLPPIEEGYRFIHYVLTFLSLLGNLITWILLGLLAKSEFPIDYVWKLIVACLKGPEYFVKVLNKEQLKLYQLQGEHSKLKEKIKRDIAKLNELNKREYSIGILEGTIKRLYKEIERRDKSVPKIIHRLERQRRLTQLDSGPLKQRLDPNLSKLERLLQILTEGTTSLEKDFERIEYILKTLSDNYSGISQTPSTELASSLLEELNQIIERNSESMEISRLSTLKRVLYLLQWVFSSKDNSYYPDISLIYSDNLKEENISLEDSTNQNLDIELASEDNINQNLDIAPASEDSINEDQDIELTNNSEELNSINLDRKSWINLVNAQIDTALTETNAASPDEVSRIKKGITREWIKRVSIYGFDNQELARIELAFDIDWNNQETNFWNSNSSEREINLSDAIERFKAFSVENTLVVEWRVQYAHPENRDYYNKELGFSPAPPVVWATQGEVFKGLVRELQKLVGIDLFPKLSIELNFEPNTYRTATRSNPIDIDSSAGCIVAFGIALAFILFINLVSPNQESNISPPQQKSSGGLSPIEHGQGISGVIQMNRSGVNAANLRLAPSINGQKVGTLQNGTRVTLGELSSDRQWRRVTTHEGRSGWVWAEFVQ